MANSGVLTKSGKGSEKWIMEKFSKFIFVFSAIYIFFYFLLSYKLTNLQFYLNLFFVNLMNLSVLFLFMSSGLALSYLRFGAILEDYVKKPHTRMMLKILFLSFNIFFFTFTFFTFIYFNFVISITTL